MVWTGRVSRMMEKNDKKETSGNKETSDKMEVSDELAVDLKSALDRNQDMVEELQHNERDQNRRAHNENGHIVVDALLLIPLIYDIILSFLQSSFCQ